LFPDGPAAKAIEEIFPLPNRRGGRGAVLAGSFARFSRSNFVRC